MLTNQKKQRTRNITSREEFRSNYNQTCGVGSGFENDNNKNIHFKIEIMKLIREMNDLMDQNAKTFHTRIDQISMEPPVLKGIDSKKYTHLLLKPNTSLELIPKRFKSWIFQYDRTSDPHEHITTYTMVVNGNDLAPHVMEFVLQKKFN